MKIKYTFVNGETSTVEVSETVGTLIMDSRRNEHANDERQRYHCYSYDAIEYEGEEYADKHTPESEFDRRELDREMQLVFESLTDIQKQRLSLYLDGYTMTKIAEIQGVSTKSVSESFEGIRKKFKIFL